MAQSIGFLENQHTLNLFVIFVAFCLLFFPDLETCVKYRFAKRDYSTSAVLDSGHDGNRHDAYDHPLVRDRLSKTTFGSNGHGNRSSLGESEN